MLDKSNGFIEIIRYGDGSFEKGEDGTEHIYHIGNKKVKLIDFADRVFNYAHSCVGNLAYYPVYSVKKDEVKDVLMDWYGAIVKSKEYEIVVR